MAIATINPATGATVSTYEPLTPGAVDQKLTLAQQAFQDYRRTPLAQRAAILHRAADLLETHKHTYGELMTLEVGKPIQSAIAEVEKSAWVCRFYADHGAAFLQDEIIPTDGQRSFVCYQPLGVILAVMPWNFPFWQVFRFAAPTLMAGNVGLLKHASNVPQCALAIEEIFAKAGLPPGVFQTLLVGGAAVAGIVQDDRVQGATLTGSEPAGASLAAAAGAVIKPTLLELGGSDPFIVLPSADLEQAAATAVTARMLNSGQSCIAAKRFILHEAIAEPFLTLMAAKIRALTVGDPRDPATAIGPLATAAIRDELDHQVQTCLGQGATALVGGDLAALQTQLPPALRTGFFYPPTLLTAIPPGTPADQEEFFGPVALAFTAPDLTGAIARANGIPLGLGASVWTTDPGEQAQAIADLEAGAVFINGLVKSDPRLPFGGIKRSGYGRELGQPGIRAFVNAKTIWIR